MKRLIPALIALSLLLSGCSPLDSSRRELEQLLLIETLGIDAPSGTVFLSAGGTTDDESAPVTLSARGATVAQALDSLHGSAYEEELFFRHTQRIVIGEKAAAKGIGGYLSYICQSPDVRLGVPVYIIEGSTANELIFFVGADGSGVSSVLEAIETENTRRSMPVFTAADIARDNARRSSALACAIRLHPGESGDAPTAVFSGYGILKGGKLRGYIGQELVAGLGLVLGSVPIIQLTVKDMYGADVTVELSSGSSTFSPEYDGSELTALNIACEVSAAVSEISGSGSFSIDGYGLFLEKQLESELLRQAREVVQLSQELNCDFAGLSERTELAAPLKYRRIEGGFSSAFPGLTVGLSVSVSISHSNDIGDERNEKG